VQRTMFGRPTATYRPRPSRACCPTSARRTTARRTAQRNRAGSAKGRARGQYLVPRGEGGAPPGVYVRKGARAIMPFMIFVRSPSLRQIGVRIGPARH
jgi:hypothetical protein